MDFNKFTLGLLVCFLLSFILGLERQFRKRSIGLRTMILVSIGSYMFVSFSFLVTGYQIDISRIAAQVVAGIGFLGAGVIIKDNEKNRVRGLTTAATLWCDAGVGLLCAGGFIKEAIVASLFVLFSNVILRYINSFVNSKVEDRNIFEIFEIVINTSNSNEVVNYIVNYDNKDNFIDIEEYKIDDKMVTFKVNVKKNDDKRINKFINKIVEDLNIKKYECRKINEFKHTEDSDEL